MSILDFIGTHILGISVMVIAALFVVGLILFFLGEKLGSFYDWED